MPSSVFHIEDFLRSQVQLENNKPLMYKLYFSHQTSTVSMGFNMFYYIEIVGISFFNVVYCK